MDFVEGPDLAEEVLEIPYRYHLIAAERLVRMGVDMIWLRDDVGQQTGMLMSPKHWRRFLKPRMAHLIATLKAINPRLKIAYHTDGCIYAIIPELIEIGVDVLNPVQPAATGSAQAQARVRRAAVLLGVDGRAAHAPLRHARRCAPRGARARGNARRGRRADPRTDPPRPDRYPARELLEHGAGGGRDDRPLS
jgi:hypothetical protein